MRRPLLSIGILGLALFGLAHPAQATVPADLDKSPIITTGLNQPTAFRFTPDGRIFIAEKGGAIRLYKNGALQAQPMITLPTANSDERGLLGLELDPNFAFNGYIYVSYTNADNFDRLSRFRVTGDVVDPASELVLLKSDQQANVFHHGGEIRFGPDGKLYWGSGMNLYNPNSQSLGTLHGKILRINSDGSIPTDNPFVNTPGANKAIWAYGLRNPFRFDILPTTAGSNAGKPITGDVGGSLWEELDVIEKGGNYGWPNAEGVCSDCGYINPVFSYPHTSPPANAGSITGVTVYTGSALPSQYDNVVFYADYTLHFIKYLVMDSDFSSVLSNNNFDLDAGTPVQLSVGPDGNLYQLNIFPGALYKIAPSGGNRAPVAQAAAAPVAGLSPLAVGFSSAGSGDPDGTAITYAWDFRDGSTSSQPNPSHTYTATGTYDVTLTVSDGAKSGTASVRITVGNRSPSGTITSPTDQSKYNAGDTIAYSGAGTDPEDGALPPSAFSWTVIFHHADHIHPFLGPIVGSKTGSFTIPRNSDNVSTTWYEIRLTVTDAGGLTHTSSVGIKPNLVNVTFGATPPGITYTIDGLPATVTQTEQAVVGVDLALGAATPQFLGGTQYVFDTWSDGGARVHTVRIPANNASYDAHFVTAPEPPAPWVSEDIGARTVAGTSAFDNGTFTIAGGGNDIWAGTDEFRYVYRPLVGDGEIIARVTDQGTTNAWAKSGVMIKESATAGAGYALIGVTPGNGMHFQHSFNSDAGEHPYSLPDGWMKLTRTGNVINAYSSPDGDTWSPIGNATLPMASTVTIGLFVSSHNDNALNVSTFDHVTVSGVGVDGEIPSPWLHTDIGGAQPTGNAGYDAPTSTFSVDGGGNDIWGAADQLSYVYQPLSGNGSIVARVKTQGDTDPWAKSGVMIKESTTAGSKYAAMLVTPGNGYHFQHDFTSDASGGPFVLPNAWVKLTREGNVFTAYTSANGLTWTQVGTATIAMSADVTVGLFVNAHNGSTALNTTTFDNVAVAHTVSAALPAPWVSSDVGAPTLAGSATFASGTFTVNGAGNDIWATDDQFQFVHQPLAADGEIVARITQQGNTDSWAKSGVMIKASPTAGSAYVALMVTPGHGVHLQSNFNTDSASGTPALPVWLRLRRAGNTVTAYRSSDGATWTTVGSATLTAANAQIGLFVNSHNGSAALNSTRFDNVTVTTSGSSGGSLPSGWTGGDVGAPALAGSSDYASGVFTLTGAGNDIWGTADQFQYVSMPHTGDVTIMARVLGQDNTDAWAKSGVMIKQSTAAGSNYAALIVTPGQGVHLQTNFASDQSGPADVAPVWLRLVRSGSTITASESVNGITWIQVGSPIVLSLTDPATVGLFVCSHNGGALNTTTFDNVTVAP